ncbi:hypothetical protein HPB47_023011, partial [Ixodes persulcatus]
FRPVTLLPADVAAAMGPSSPQWEAVPEVRRDFSFNMHVVQGVSTEQVIQAFLALVPHSSGPVCHRYGGGRIALTVKNADAAGKLRNAGRLVINGKDYDLLPLASKIKNVPEEAVAQVLGANGKRIRMTRETHREYPTLETGSRRVTLEMKRELPNYISVCGFQGMCLYPGMKRACRRYGQGGHLSYDWRTPRCTRCGAHGHTGSECHAQCTRCGQDHSTSWCRVSTYATVLSGGSPQDGQEEREDTPSTSNNREGAVSETAEVEAKRISSHEAAASTDGGTANRLVLVGKEPRGTTTGMGQPHRKGRRSARYGRRIHRVRRLRLESQSKTAQPGKTMKLPCMYMPQSMKRPRGLAISCDDERSDKSADLRGHPLPALLCHLPKAPKTGPSRLMKKDEEVVKVVRAYITARLREPVDQAWWDREEIKEECRGFYTHLYVERQTDNFVWEELCDTPPRLTGQEARRLEDPITRSECWEVLASSSKGKDPGPDGLPAEVLLSFWDLLADSLVRVYNTTLGEGNLPLSMRLGLSRLISKDTEHQICLSAWRPITLLNTSRKILAKVLQTRMASLLGKLVSLQQVCSVPGRSIQKNLFALRDLRYWADSRNIATLVLTVDQEKSVLRVSHHDIFHVLERLGFGYKCLGGLQCFYTAASSAVQLNGRTSQPFPIHAGVRQGCPMSPLLFVIIFETFVGHLSKLILPMPTPGNRLRSMFFAYANDLTICTTSEA